MSQKLQLEYNTNIFIKLKIAMILYLFILVNKNFM